MQPVGKNLVLGSRTLQYLLGSDGNKGHHSQSLSPLGLSQTSRMSSLVSGQLMGVFQRRLLLLYTGADETAQGRLITSMTTVENSQRTRTRMRERMLSDSHWSMCALEVQVTNSWTMRTASV